MKRIIFLSSLVLGTLAHADTLLIDFNYRLQANRPYTTGLYRVFGAPVATQKIVIKQSGSTYCDLRANRVQYNTTINGPLRDASPAVGTNAAEYDIVDGVVNAIEVSFFQNRWDDVDCTLRVYSVDGTNPVGSEQLLGAIHYGGGFVAKAQLTPTRTLSGLTRLRFAVPAFCTGVSVLEVGTISGGTFYAAQGVGGGAYRVSPLGGQGVTAIEASLNGPLGAGCDIPVYGQVPAVPVLRAP